MYEYNPLTVPSIELIQEQQRDAKAENPIMEFDLGRGGGLVAKMSDCCSAYDRAWGDASYEDVGICPDCKEHCEFVDEEEDEDDAA